MKRNLRFYFALFFAKATALVLKLIGRKGTSMPGSWAIILCPDFLGRIQLPEKVIGITGTNGKTTMANMAEDVLEQNGYSFTCNRSGTNVNTGVASSLIADSTFFGKPKNKLAVFELDERSSPKILPYIKPDMLLCTNFFRDSYKRNAHMEFILNILENSIPPETKLILNSDDLICSELCINNPRTYFGIQKQPGETAEMKNIICDVRSCPRCGGRLEWDFIRYHHIGRAKCMDCGFENPRPDYEVTEIDSASMEMTVRIKDETSVFPLPNANLINIYNALSTVAFLLEFGLTKEQIISSLEKTGISESRYLEEDAGGKKIILHLAKGQNPVACSRVFDNIRNYPGKKAVMLFLDDYFDAAHSVENIAWLYETDYQFLTDPSIVQVVAAGARHFDNHVRMLMAGLPEEKIVHMEDNYSVVDSVDIADADSIFILYDVYTINLASEIKDKLKDRIKREVQTNEN